MLTSSQIDSTPLAEGRAIRKLRDGDGLFLQIDSKAKGWRFRYRYAGKDSLLSLGPYPAVSPETAREKAAAIRAQLDKGENPAESRRKERDEKWQTTANTFGKVAADYNHARQDKEEKTRERNVRMLKHSARLHSRTLEDISRADVVALCQTFERTGKRETAHRLWSYVGRVYRFAADTWYKGEHPTMNGIGEALQPVKVKNRTAITDLRGVCGLMSCIDAHEGFDLVSANVRNALRLLPRTLVRPGELANAEWSEFDLTGERHAGMPTWVIPLHRMKMRDGNRTDHIVPLAAQAVQILMEQHEVTGYGKYVFVNARSDKRPLSDGALSAALASLGYKGQQHPHGFRRMGKTLIQDVLKLDSELVERQLAHRIGNSVAAAYDASQRLDERRDMLQQYSDLLDRVRDTGKV